MSESIMQSALLVFLTEMGDKTQILALILAARFKRPWAILSGIATATVANHFLASLLGQKLSHWVDPRFLKLGLAVLFIGFAIWVLIPDKYTENPTDLRWGAFLTTSVLFFLAEIGDKTQISTFALAAHYQNTLYVTAGTTLGMLAADGGAVWLGQRFTDKIPMKWIRIGASLLYLMFAIWILKNSAILSG